MNNDYLLNGKGFVFIDDRNKPFWVAIRYGKPMLAYWHEAQKSWVNLRELTQTEIWQMSKLALPENEAEIYHKKHKDY